MEDTTIEAERKQLHEKYCLKEGKIIFIEDVQFFSSVLSVDRHHLNW